MTHAIKTKEEFFSANRVSPTLLGRIPPTNTEIAHTKGNALKRDVHRERNSFCQDEFRSLQRELLFLSLLPRKYVPGLNRKSGREDECYTGGMDNLIKFPMQCEAEDL